ncbi:CPBP family intramembrane metalloprotease [Tolypothrix sp. FACHB-123]|uniref:CPBP family intramembrane glutamic endopeptidase n=1 Tax=Tolypothrix sp. FACHB-123 TaxID=2692868 RepID=UPI0016834F39|nr:CPBP family intramembrane glutamic endopeptidase [Tolypothrix sp. FACHB-123]MBD2354333.1 CPBP family intramembrane metalloprotease [Tolypothrix sp. FACHB-123]
MTPENSSNPFLKLKVRNLCLRALLLTIGLGIVLGLVQGLLKVKFNSQVMTLVLYILIFGFLCLWEIADFNRFGIRLQYVVGRVPKKHKWLPMAGLVLLIILFSLSAYLVSFYLLSLAAPSFVENVMRQLANSPSPRNTESPFYNLLAAIVYIVIAPITEEFLFRGIILQRWASKWGITTALIISGVMFGMLHANVLGLSLFGIIMGVLYIKTRTLIVPIACHAFNNSLAVGMGLLASGSKTTTSMTNQIEQLRSIWWFGVVLMLISLPLLARFLYRNWPRQNTLIPYFINSFQHGE